MLEHKAVVEAESKPVKSKQKFDSLHPTPTSAHEISLFKNFKIIFVWSLYLPIPTNLPHIILTFDFVAHEISKMHLSELNISDHKFLPYILLQLSEQK